MRIFPLLEVEETRNGLLRLQEALLRNRDEITAVAAILEDNDNNFNSKGLAAAILNRIGLPENSARYIIREILQLNIEDTQEIFIGKFNKLNSFIAILIENIDIFIEHIIYMNEYINYNMIIDINIMQRVCEILAPNEQPEQPDINNGLFEIIRKFLMIAVNYNSNNIIINNIVAYNNIIHNYNIVNNIDIININYIRNDIMSFIDNNIVINKDINLEQSKVLINGMQITEAILTKLKEAYVGVTGYHFDNDKDFLILTDIIQAINLIYNGKTEYDFEEVMYTQSFIQLKSVESRVCAISAKKFVEDQMKNGTLEGIIQKLKASEETDVRNSGDILDLILINKVKKLSPSLRRRYSF